MSEIGLFEQAISLALLFFNMGVELGQLVFIAGVVVFGVLVRRIVVALPTWASPLPAYGIGAVAAFWTIEQVAGF